MRDGRTRMSSLQGWKMRRPMRCLKRTSIAVAAGVCLALAWFGSGRPAVAAEESAPPTATLRADDAKVQQLLHLLSDPAIRQYLSQAPSEGAKESGPAPEPAASNAMATSLGNRLQGFRNHLGKLVDSVHEVPSQTLMAQAMAADALKERGIVSTALDLAAFVILGFGAQWLFHLVARPSRHWLLALKLDTVDDRLRAVSARLVYGLGLLLSYAVGSVGAFLLFDWPVLIKALLLGFLVAFLVVRLSAVVGRFLLAPGATRFRVVPISTEAAWFFHLRLVACAILLSFGWQIVVVLGRFGLSDPVQELSLDVLGLALLLLGLETLWRMPPFGSAADEISVPTHHPRLRQLLGSAILVALWVLWLIQAVQLFWLTVFAVGVPLVIMAARASVAHILRPVGAVVAPEEASSVHAVLFERGVRSLIIITAALLLGWIFDIDVVSLTMRDTIGTRLLRGLISVVVIALAADFLWTVIRALIDSKLKQAQPRGGSEIDAGHAARLQTLLPIVSNMLLATIVIVAVMMILSALGVQIGPLVASAGVVGVAIGFGAQTLVKDIISGIFYLVDDAFRIGEYIQSGNYKGTVESFSLRSVKLRHQRGALYTVPFGVLGAVQNQSRDWVVDKILLNVPYGTDLDKVRKLIKKIGEELAEDPEFAPDIIAPLKMQGVSQFGDYAIQIQTKMMTKPGDVQFMARRRALLRIKQAFEANNIGFAMPTVQVASDSTSSAAAQGLVMMAANKAAAE